MLKARIAVLKLFFAEQRAGFFQGLFVLVGLKGFDLAGIVFVDGLFDGDRAGHGSFFAHKCRCSAQGKPGGVPKWQERSWAHASLGHQIVER